MKGLKQNIFIILMSVNKNILKYNPDFKNLKQKNKQRAIRGKEKAGDLILKSNKIRSSGETFKQD